MARKQGPLSLSRASSGSSGFGSVSSEHMDNRIFDIVRAGLQLSFRMSMQISPVLLLIFGWKILVTNLILGAVKG